MHYVPIEKPVRPVMAVRWLGQGGFKDFGQLDQDHPGEIVNCMKPWWFPRQKGYYLLTKDFDFQQLYAAPTQLGDHFWVQRELWVRDPHGRVTQVQPGDWLLVHDDEVGISYQALRHDIFIKHYQPVPHTRN